MTPSILRKAAFSVAVAASLGFGAAQAFAAPAQASEAEDPRCQTICVFQCGAPGGREIFPGGPCICCLR